ncbi:MAG: type IX secretion system sortase PorU [Bacteroidetes bacterium]|nr:type IX secretion system sortase PorU [Bacteroidota bacterium]
MSVFIHPRERTFFLKTCLVSFLLMIAVVSGHSQSIHQHRILKWLPAGKVETGTPDSMKILRFDGAGSQYEKYGALPVWLETFPLDKGNNEVGNRIISNPVYEQINSSELTGVKDLERIPESMVPETSVSTQRTKSILTISFVPVRKNNETGTYERLISFDLAFDAGSKPENTGTKIRRSYAANSVLSSGTWYKMAIPLTGVYMISASYLKNADPAFSSVDPRTIRIYGNNGAMLAEANATPRIDDLRELAIKVVGSDPAKLNDNDYILFYAIGPDAWQYNRNDNLFHHQKNLYSDYSFCFLTFGQGTGKRVEDEPSTTLPANNTITHFNDYAFFEPSEINLIKSGRAWFSKDLYELTTTRDYWFNFASLYKAVPVKIIASVAARSTSLPTTFTMYADAEQLASVSIPIVGSYYTDIYAYERQLAKSHTVDSSSFDVKLDFTRSNTDGIGYLRYLEVNAMSNLFLSGGQTDFRSVIGSGAGLVSEFHLTAGSQPVSVWDVSDPSAIKSIGTSQNGNQVVFRVPTDTITEFLAYDGTNFYSVQSFTKVENQDLHSTGNPDLVIVTHPSFISQANNLASYHQQHDNMNVLVTTPEKIYNEFSSGAQDITAIRDYMKMIYDKSGKTAPRYLLMFGDASYDYKSRLQVNSNFVPTFESAESMDPVSSIVTDDYFGILDDNEGQGSAGMLDIGVGRFPVQTTDQADAAVKKVMHYSSNTDSVKNDWRNVICFVADNGDDNMHMRNADTVHIYDSAYNVDKIYLDAYDRISTPGGLRYPDVNEAITRRVEKGALVMNYVGHGGILGWAHERVLEIPQIKSWSNFDNMPVFLTATCEFSYFDDPSWTSAGEWVFLNPGGGGIALLTTTRPTYADGNVRLTTGFYINAFNKVGGEFPRLGDLIMDSKNFSGGDANTRKFVLLGDPALQMAYPKLHVMTTSIQTADKKSTPQDTIKALSTVTISGEIRDDDGNRVTNFNGTVFPTVYDKYSVITTIAGEGNSPFTFQLRKNVIYKGKLAVTNGQFTFSFIVPKDIAYNFGGGKISYYARSNETDANGYDQDFIVGGYNNGAGVDDEGPAVRLFMNDTNFVSGGITDQNPVLLALVADSSGINTVGNGIGHDLTATLDGYTQNQKILNDYYVADLNTFKTGKITYPFYSLSDGPHTVTVKVWDVYNNSSEASLDFVVASSAELALEHVFNYPNPFREETTFSFEYNRPETEMDVRIEIYSFTGQKIKTILQPLYSEGYRANTIHWDGTGDNGAKIGSGMYVYNVKVTTPDGMSVYKSSKLVVIR